MTTVRWMSVVVLLAFSPGCEAVNDLVSKVTGSEESEEKESKKKKKKKKKKESDDGDDKSKDEDRADVPAAPSGVEVPGIAGFVVPPGGTYKQVSLPIKNETLTFENYSYPTASHPRDKLRADFQKLLGAAGWSVSPDGETGYFATKGTVKVKVLFGEASDTETKINVFPPT